MNAFRFSPAFCASPLRLSSAGPTAPLVPAAASAWQPPQPALPVKMVLPLSALPAAPVDVPPVDVPPPDDEGGGVEVGVDAGVDVPPERDAVESGRGPSP